MIYTLCILGGVIAGFLLKSFLGSPTEYEAGRADERAQIEREARDS